MVCLGPMAPRNMEKSYQKKFILALERKEPLRNFYFLAFWNFYRFLNDTKATGVCRLSKLDS